MVSHPKLGSDPPIGSDRESGCDKLVSEHRYTITLGLRGMIPTQVGIRAYV